MTAMGWVGRILIASCVVTGSFLASASDSSLDLVEPAEVGMSAAKLAEAEKLFVEAVRQGKVIGYQLLVARRGKVVLSTAGGLRDLEKQLPMTTETLVDIASMTKSLTAIGLLKMVDEGLVSLDDRVSKHLVGFAEPPSSQITIRQLLLHRGGYMSFAVFPDGLTPNSEDVPDAPSLIVEARELGLAGPDVEPGTIFRYNNMGYNVVGAIIEKISGLKLDEYFEKALYQPLGMTSTFADSTELDSDRLARKYWLHEGVWEELTGVPPRLARANGGTYSTALDFARFCQMLLDEGRFGGETLLEKETIALATSPLIEVSEAYLSQEVEAEMGFESEWYEYRDPRDLNIDRARGLGFVVSDAGVYSHAGIYGTFFYVDPARELFGLILTQSIYGGNPGQAFIEAVNAAIIDGKIVRNSDSPH